MTPRSLRLSLILILGAVTAHCQIHPDEHGLPCPHIITDMIPGLTVNLPHQSLAHVEIRHCDAVGPPMQVVAWKAGAAEPTIVLDVARFSYGPLLMDKNVVAIVFPGPYDSVVVVQYQHGEPKLVFTDSTHAEIRLATTSQGVIVTLDSGHGKMLTKTFEVDEGQLDDPLHGHRTPKGQVSKPQYRRTTVQDILKSSKRMDGMRVEVRGDATFGFETSVLVGPPVCSNSASRPCAIWLEFDDCLVSGKGPQVLQCRQLIENLRAGRQQEPGGYASRIVIKNVGLRGRLSTVRKDITYDKSLPSSARVGFGHLGSVSC